MTKIEWTRGDDGAKGETWNPIVGCSRVSAGCSNCYAERHTHRGITPHHRGLTVLGKHGPRWTGEVRFVEHVLPKPLEWRKPRRIFVNSLSDLFHEALTNEQIASVFGVMAACPQHTFQVLTKRPERARAWFAWIAEQGDELRASVGEDPTAPGGEVASACAVIAKEVALGGPLTPAAWRNAMRAPWPLPNVWLGVSVEDQATADERLPILVTLPAQEHFVSYEPALGPVRWSLPTRFSRAQVAPSARDLPSTGIDWIIVGGESGAGARPFDVAWARATVEACKAAGVACFVKQLGANVRTRNDDNFTIEEDPPDPEHPFWPTQIVADDRVEDLGERYQGAPVRVRLRDRKGGDMSEWRSDLRVREFPQ